MSDQIKNGGAAFPHWEFRPGPHGSGHHVLTGGMTLRDWFAGTCPHETAYSIARQFCEPGSFPCEDELARARYVHADAMLKAREATQ
jgi:hypothetical protein